MKVGTGVGLALAVFSMGAALFGAVSMGQAQAMRNGKALFQGDAPLPARLAGHDMELPTMASRCSNCHDAANPPPSTVAGGPRSFSSPGVAMPSALESAAYADRLDGSLATPRSRRGGPPSTYDAMALCRLLRTGVDPALVMISPTMPRYEPSEQQCQDLWRYLVAR